MKLVWKLVFLSFIIACIMALVGCSTGATDDIDSDPWGAVEISRLDSVRIAVITPSSGDALSAAGTDIFHGVELALADHGPIQGFDVEAVRITAQCSAGGGSSAALSVTADPSIVAVIGPPCSTACEAALPIFDEAHYSAISPGCGASILTDQALHNEAFMRTLYDDRLEGESAARFAYLELGLRRAATISDGTIETSDLVSAFEGAFLELGGTVVASEAITPGETNFTPQLSTISAVDPDLIYAPLLPSDAVALTLQRAKAEIARIPLIGGRHYRNNEYIQAIGESADGVFSVSPYITGDSHDALQARYEEQFNESPATLDYIFAYDAAQIILNAIERSSTSGQGTLIVGRQAFRDALYNTTMFDGLTGTITCSTFGDCSAAPIAVFELDNQNWEVIYIP